MRILHLIQKKQNRGAETFTCQLATHQKRIGHVVKVVSIFEGQSQLNYDEEINSLDGSTTSRLIDLKAWAKLNNIVKDFEPDLIQANAGDTLKYAVLSKMIFQWSVPIVFRNASEVGRYLNTAFQKKFNSILYRHVDQVISVSQLSAKDIGTHFPFLKKKTEVIPIGIESKVILNNIEFDSSLKHIVHVGGFTFEKNHKGLIEIIRLALAKNDRLHLHLIGDGPLKKEIEAKVKANGLENYVSFYGFVSNPLSYIKAADVLVLPSVIEGLPAVILEAMYCKTPVVAYDVGGISEILNENTGELIEANNQDAFVKAILMTIEGDNSIKINRANELVTHEFLNSEIAKKFLSNYKLLLQS